MSGRRRRSGLTAEVQRLLVEGAELGLTRQLQADYAGVGVSTLRNWLSMGRKASTGKHRALLDAVERAEGQGAAKAMRKIKAAAEAGDWKAAAWFMERRHGYRRGGSAEAGRERDIEEVETLTELEATQRQLREVAAATRQALTSDSWQGYAALQRLQRSLRAELRVLQPATQDDELSDIDSPAFRAEMERAMAEWPDQLLELAIRTYERRHTVKLLEVVEGGRAG